MEKTNYPYFVQPMLQELASTTDSERATMLRRRIAANVGDSDALSDLLGLTDCSLTDFYDDLTPPTPDTDDTIKIFLERFGHGNEDKTPGETADIEEIATPAIDYAAMMLEGDDDVEDKLTGDATSDAIDSFLKAVPPKTPKPRRKETSPQPEQPTLTESFAKILIKNRNYSKALDIIKELNLKNPEKSIYFADQIRFLEKLIANEEQKNNVSGN